MKKIIIPLLFCAFVLLTLAKPAHLVADDKVIDMRPIDKIAYADRIIEAFYVDTVNGGNLADKAIVAMLKTLDPHSTYSDADETRELTQPLDGNFSGIGIQFNMLNDTLHVIQTTAGGPSEKVGILAGDRILRADTVAISGAKKPNSEVIKVLRGPKGTVVDLLIQRRGVAEPITFRVTRDDIPIYSVDAAYMADDEVGYIRISRFAEDTDKELTEAMRKLRKQGMRHLILDLEDNGGGYLGSAFQIASHFLHKGDPVVYTESPRLGSANYDTESEGDFTDGRLVILVNQYSASASEILAGAIQDNDRGVVVGRRTFGKGLVQRPFPFPDGSMIRLTVSRYHTPSGRCIQKPYTLGDGDDYALDMKRRVDSGELMSADSIHFDDSLRYETLRSRRIVYGGGGIMPDRFVPVDTTAYTDYYRDLIAKGVLNKFAVSYVDDNRAQLKKQYKSEAQFVDTFTVTDEMLDQLVELGDKEGVEVNAGQLETSRKAIITIVKAIIGRDLFETSTYFRVTNPTLNPVYTTGLDLIRDPATYHSILSGS